MLSLASVSGIMALVELRFARFARIAGKLPALCPMIEGRSASEAKQSRPYGCGMSPYDFPTKQPYGKRHQAGSVNWVSRASPL
jgi:hypothetical protein